MTEWSAGLTAPRHGAQVVKTDWQVRPPHHGSQELAKQVGLHPHAAQVLLTRLLTEGDDFAVASQFLTPKLSQLSDPALLSDIDAACAVLTGALTAGAPICIYGDYDVDGTSSAAILVESLRHLGGNVAYYLPHRILQGYGLHREAVDEIAQRGFKLLVTADLGISNANEVAYAKEKGLQVIILDHHQVPAQLPTADAVINPHRPGDQFPFKPLCAAGVAFHLLIALRRALRTHPALGPKANQWDLKPVLDLVALATVADMVPLTGINRILVVAGLEQMRKATRPGLVALCQVAAVDITRADAQTLGFTLGPRVNAAGRMGSAMRCVELFLSDGLLAKDLAARLDQANVSRKAVEEFVITQAERQAAHRESQAALALYSEEWHPGVVGIVASRLVEKFGKPVLVIGTGGKGSARTAQGINVLAALTQCSEHFVKFGGHPAAAGVTLKDGHADALQNDFAAAVRALHDQPTESTLWIDAHVEAAELARPLIDDLAKVGPFGIGFAEPLFLLREQRVVRRRQVGNGHLKLELESGLHAIGFRMAAHDAAQSDFVDLVCTPELNEFRGQTSIQLRLKDMRVA